MNHLTEFTNEFADLCRRHGKGRAFSDFVEIAACAVHQEPYHLGLCPKDADYERIEKKYLDVIGRYEKDEINQIVKLFGITKVALIEDRNDFLGAAYMQLEVANAKSGQFFTPPSVSRLMAEMTFSDVASVIKEKGFVTVSEPAAGSGGMVIEAANVLERQGFDPRSTMWFQAIDVDRTCFNMAYVQLSTLGLCGEVVHGNTLSMQLWEKRATPQWRIMQRGDPVLRAALAVKAMVAPAPQAAEPVLTAVEHKPASSPFPSQHTGNGKSASERPKRYQFELDLDR